MTCKTDVTSGNVHTLKARDLYEIVL